MSDKSNNLGRAYEFACLHTLHTEILKHRPVQIEMNSSYYAAKKAWDSISTRMQTTFEASALAGVLVVFDLEPLILDDGDDVLELKLQTDSEGRAGDVRDVLIIRRGIRWEIGLSIKHNHFAVKHSRLSEGLDFGDKWFGVRCSDQYWSDVTPIFDYLKKEKKAKTKWSDLPDKAGSVYVPLLNAFANELRRAYQIDKTVPKKIVSYLLGQFDFYKVVSIDDRRITHVQSFNLRGTLNKAGKNKPVMAIPVAALPTRFVSIDFKPDSTNTIEVYLDGGWQFSFRIHNAATLVETSLKFDVQIIGMPTTIISIDRKWGE